MENFPYNENILFTTDPKEAAVWVTFGGKLRQHLPIEYEDVYQSRDDYLEGRHPSKRWTFNFERNSFPEKAVKEAFEDQDAEQKFTDSLEGLDEQKKALILAAHSRAEVRTCRELLEKREFLIELFNRMGPQNKWDTVKGDGSGSLFVKFGKRCSDELRAENLSKL